MGGILILKGLDYILYYDRQTHSKKVVPRAKHQMFEKGCEWQMVRRRIPNNENDNDYYYLLQ